VIYPILKLSDFNMSIRDYLCLLQKTTIEFFKNHGIETFTKDESPGVYTSSGKIAFFGIRVQKGVTFHGLSINVSNEIEDFSLIKSCGSNVEKFDQMTAYGISEPLEILFQKWMKIFLQKLGV
jgi:lipoyl(octanoyl) transferase